MRGGRQGENLSPILFSLYLNDLENYLMKYGANDIVCHYLSFSLQMIQYYLVTIKTIYSICSIYLNNTATNGN